MSFFLIALISFSCLSTDYVAKKITVESGQIPSSMKTENFILIGVLKGRRSYDKYVKKEFATYKGKYVLATEKEIETKYSDISKYRYVMDYEQETDIMPGVDSYGQTKKTTGYRYFILDRKENKKYLRKSRSSAFAKEMKAYLTAIDAVRTKN